MRCTHSKIVAAAASTMLVLAACGNAGEDDEGADTPDVEVQDQEFEAGTTMAELQEQGSIVIGVKYDQPGIGFVKAGEEIPEGFDPEMGKIIAAGLGIEEGDIEWKETISDNREPFLENGEVDIVVLDHSRATPGGRPGRSLLRDRPAADGRR